MFWTVKTPKNADFRALGPYDVTWWRHNANIETDFSSLLKNLSIDVSHVYRRPVEKFDPIFGPLLWRHRAIFRVLWRHRSKDREKLNKHGKFRKICWSRFCGAQKIPIVDTFTKSGPLEKKYAHATWLDRNFFLKSHFIRFKKKNFSYTRGSA